MVRRRPGANNERSRVVPSGTRRTVATQAKRSGLTLDDAPLSIRPTRDQKRLLVCLPYDLWVVEVDGEQLRYAQNIELDAAEPSVCEAEKGELWIGGKHLRRSSVFDSQASKFGSKLGGYVDDVALLRPGLLCGVGHQGEVLLDLESGEVLHRRKAKGNRKHRVAASADERAVFVDETSHAWVIDPAHPGGYTKLRLEHGSDDELDTEALVRVEVDHKGRCLLGARDGAIGWTKSSLRRAGEHWVELSANEATPLSLGADDEWIYVLRPRGRVQRFSLPAAKAKAAQHSNRRGRLSQEAAQEEPPPPEAQELRLDRVASCMCVLRQADGTRLVFGGAQSQGMLGRLWSSAASAMPWEPLRVSTRPTRETPSQESSAPNFEKIRNKIDDHAPTLAALDVDAVVGASRRYWVISASGSLLERRYAAFDVDALLPGDCLLLPAMLRPREGTARPGLIVWPGVPEDREVDPTEALCLCWGDDPRGWMPLHTPQIRSQRWKRNELFPLQVALQALPDAPGKRARLPRSWTDPELFDALARECKKMLKVLW